MKAIVLAVLLAPNFMDNGVVIEQTITSLCIDRQCRAESVACIRKQNWEEINVFDEAVKCVNEAITKRANK